MDTLLLDDNGGGALVGECGNAHQGTWLVVKEMYLRALDIHDDPVLEVLDFRDCGAQTHLHLQLDRLPNLRMIYLPELSQGAVIHLFCMDVPRSLFIDGNVTELDADWQAGTLRLVSHKSAYENVRLLGHDAHSDDLYPSADKKSDGGALTFNPNQLSVVLNPSLLPASLRLSGEGTWMLPDASHVEQCVIDGPAKVSIEKASVLETLTIQSSGAYDVAGIKALATVKGAHNQLRETPSSRPPSSIRHAARKHLTLHGSVKALTFADAWDHVQLHTPHLTTLTLSWAKHVALHHCRALTTVSLPDGVPVECYGSVPHSLLNQARFFIDESTLAQCLTRIEAGEHGLLEGVLNVLAQRHTPHGVFYTLSTLVRLAKQGIALNALWQCRRALSGWQRLGGRKRKRLSLTHQDYQRADKRWAWQLPVDRVEEGFSADLHLWALCMPHCSDARAYRKTLLKEAQKRDCLVHLLRVATVEQGLPALVELATDVLVALYGQGEWARLSLPNAQAGVARYLPRLLRARDLTPLQTTALLNAIANLAPWTSLPALLAHQLAYKSGPTRALLMMLSRQSDEWFRWRMPGFPNNQHIATAKQQLLQLALVPASGARTLVKQMEQSAVIPEPDWMVDDGFLGDC